MLMGVKECAGRDRMFDHLKKTLTKFFILCHGTIIRYPSRLYNCNRTLQFGESVKIKFGVWGFLDKTKRRDVDGLLPGILPVVPTVYSRVGEFPEESRVKRTFDRL